MRILVVTPYAPIRDGIASYALQQVKALRAAGNDVEVLSPQPSAAHHHLDLRRPRGVLALAKRVRRYDRVVIQFHPDVFYLEGSSVRRHAATTAALLVVALATRHLEVLVHEIDYAAARRANLDAYLSRRFWRRVDSLLVHTEAERSRMQEAFSLPAGRVEVVHHGSSFERRAHLDRAAARSRLGLAEERHIFVSIGFIQPHKGFDRAVRALRALPTGAAELHVVGSLRVEDRRYERYLAELAAAVEATPGAYLHEEYVSDELFDVWLVAADTVVLPYRHIWSSSVLERAALYGTQVIATRVGGLEGQAPEGSILIEDDFELAEAMAGVLDPAHLGAGEGEIGMERRDDLMRRIRERGTSARGRPLVADHSALRGASRRAGSGARRRAGGWETLEPLEVPEATSTRPLARNVKRFIRRLTAWQLQPIVDRVNDLQAAIAELAARSAAPAAGRDQAGGPADRPPADQS